MDDAKQSCKNIYFGDRRFDKRKGLEDFEDRFDNGYSFEYCFENRNMYLKRVKKVENRV